MDLPALNSDANESLRRARATAVEQGRGRAQPGDILIGILGAGTVASRVLGLYGADRDMLIAAITTSPQGTPSWSTDPDAELGMVGMARAEAARLLHEETGSEHLLLALLRKADSLPAGLLGSQGLTLDSTREAIRFLHGQVPDWEPPTTDRMGAQMRTGRLDHVASELSPEELSDEDRARIRAWGDPDLQPVMSHLERVVGIGQTVVEAGLVVEMIALEVRDTGCVLHWYTQPDEKRLIGTPEMTISDDLGTKYEVRLESSSGSEREMRGRSWVTPAPPEAARTLHIEVRSFGRDGQMPERFRPPREQDVQGSWRFEVLLSD